MNERLSELATVSATREVLDRFGLSTKKALGQHFLVNDGVVAHICDLAELTPDDDVMEIGPGIGTLTVALLKRCATVTAIERDADLPQVLAFTCADYADRFTLLNKDALEVTASDFASAPAKLVSNLPYAVAATLVLDMFERLDSLQSATVMVQAEVADRMCASIGTKNYGAYTVKLSLFAVPSGRFAVSEGNFFPPPRVKSSVLRLDRIDRGLSFEEIHAIMTMADAAFATRRKTLRNSCRTYFKINRPDLDPSLLETIFEECGIDPSRRGESLSLAEFIMLGKCYLSHS